MRSTNSKPSQLPEIDGGEAIRIARKALANHFDLRLASDRSGGRMYGVGKDAEEAARAYNWLAANHARIGRVII
jgi:hypothetical protein